MDVALRLESQRLAEEVYALIQQLDPATFRAELEAAARARLADIRQRAIALQARLEAERGSSARAPRFEEALRRLAELADEASRRATRKREAWRATFKRLQPEYAALAARLREYRIELPRIRPTNVSRSLLHVATGLLVLVMIEHVFTTTMTLAAGSILLGVSWFLEMGRRVWPPMNAWLMRGLGRFAHGHEWHRVNSATWYNTALFAMVVAFPIEAASVGVMVLALADPAAALVGRRYGRVRLLNGRTLAGCLTFFAVALPTAWAVVSVYHEAPLTLEASVLVALAAATAGMLTELLTRRIDDNFTIPVVVAAVVTGALSLLG